MIKKLIYSIDKHKKVLSNSLLTTFIIVSVVSILLFIRPSLPATTDIKGLVIQFLIMIVSTIVMMVVGIFLAFGSYRFKIWFNSKWNQIVKEEKERRAVKENPQNLTPSDK